MKFRLIVPPWIALAVGSALLIAARCQKASTPIADVASNNESAAVSIVEGETPSVEQKQAMPAAKDALFEKLSGRLMEAMGSRGPAS